MTSFPNRVWEPSSDGDGWITRPPTDNDYARRRVVSQIVHTTDPERLKQLHNLLAKIQKAGHAR